MSSLARCHGRPIQGILYHLVIRIVDGHYFAPPKSAGVLQSLVQDPAAGQRLHLPLSAPVADL